MSAPRWIRIASGAGGLCRLVVKWCPGCLLDGLVCVIVIAVAGSFAGIQLMVSAGVAGLMLGPIASESSPSAAVVPGRQSRDASMSQENDRDRDAGSRVVDSSHSDSGM